LPVARCQKLRKNGALAGQEGAIEAKPEVAAYRYSVRTDSEPIALRASWSMHVEAMNFNGMGHAE